MKNTMKFSFSLVLLFLTTNFLHAQVTAEVYEKVVTEKIELSQEVKELKKRVSELERRVKTDSTKIINFTAETAQKAEELKKLKDELTALKNIEKEKIAFEKDATKNKDQITRLEKEITDLNTEIATLKSQEIEGKKAIREKEGLENQIKMKDEEIAKLKTTIEEMKTKLADYETVKNQNTALSNQVENLKKETENKNTQITALELIKAEKIQLEKDKKALETQNQTYSNQITAKETEIEGMKADKAKWQGEKNQLATELNATKTTLATNLSFTVEYVVNSSDYNTNEADKLIQKCNESSSFLQAGKLSEFTTKLNQYKNLCEAIKKAKDVLASQYDKTKANTALSALKGSGSYANPSQTKDITTYSNLIGNYCEKISFVQISSQSANAYQYEAPEKTKQAMRFALEEVDPKYEYLRKEIYSKISDPTYKCKVSPCK
jgi:myosin heavy subunit